MALQKQFLNIPFIGGLDENQDKHVVEPPLVRVAENLVCLKKGSLQVRDTFANVETGVPSTDAVMHRFKEDLVVMSRSEYGVFDVSDETYRKQGETVIGSKTTSSGANNTLLGSHHTMVGTCVDRSKLAVGFVTTDAQKRSTTHIRVYSVDGDALLYETSFPDRYLLDVTATSGGTAFVVRHAENLITDPDNREVEILHLVETAGVFSVTTTLVTATGVGTPRGVRQAQIISGGNQVVWLIVSFLPFSKASTQWGATYVVRVDLATGMSSLGEVVSDGSAGQVARDGSAMVAIGWDAQAQQPLFMTCTMQTGDVYVFTHNAFVCTVGNKIHETEHDYGVPYWAATPAAAKYIWHPVDTTGVGGSGPGALNLDLHITYPGDSFASFDSYGHNFMYGWCEKETSSNQYVFAWHGVNQWGSRRRANVNDSSFEVHTDRPKLLGCVFVKASRSGTTFTTSDKSRAHCCHLLSRPNQVSSTRWDVPVAAASKWYYTIQDPGEEATLTSGFLTFRMQLGDNLVSDNGLQYLHGAILDLKMSGLELSTRSLFGQDQVMPHTSPFPMLDRSHFLSEKSDLTVGQITEVDNPEEWSLFDVHLSGLALVHTGYCVGSTRWASRDIGALYDGPRGANLVKSNDGEGNAFNWNNAGRRAGALRETSAMWVKVEKANQVSAPAPGYLIVDSGRPAVYDGTNMFPLDWYLPPQPVLQRESGMWGNLNAAGDRTSQVTACWVYRDAYGVVWRSAPGFVASYGLKRWRGDPNTVSGVLYFPNTILAVFDRPLPLATGLAGKIGIEYYVDSPPEPEDNLNDYNGSGELTMYGWADVGSGTTYPSTFVGTPPDDDEVYRDFGLSLGYKIEYTGQIPILLYTTGGVLPDEPPVGANYMTAASGRIWYIRDGKAFFSKQVSQGKPIGFNADLYVDSPNGENLVAVSHMDEYTVLFSKNNVFVCAGQGPNDLGSGQSYYPVEVASDVGCHNPNSVLSTGLGVFFAGPDTFYLLRRDMQVVRIGNVEESVKVSSITSAVHDRTKRRCIWHMVGDDYATEKYLVFDYENGLWFTWVGSDVNGTVSMAWTPTDTYILTSSGAIKRQDPHEEHPSAVLETGWIHIGQVTGFKRFRNCYVVSRTSEEDAKAYFYIDFGYDYDPTFAQTEWLDPGEMDPDHDIARVKPLRQKCASFKLRIRTQAVSCVLSHIGLEVGVKNAGHKIARGPMASDGGGGDIIDLP